MAQKADIHKAAGVIIRDRTVLVSRSKGKDFFVSPGGKLEAEETALQALVRELQEEQGITVDPTALEPLGTYYAVAQGHEDQKLTVCMEVYIVGTYQGELSPHGEIAENRWINSTTDDIELGSIFAHDIIPRLKADGLID
jgi:8-oxo-dGTP diphosphatase